MGFGRATAKWKCQGRAGNHDPHTTLQNRNKKKETAMINYLLLLSVVMSANLHPTTRISTSTKATSA